MIAITNTKIVLPDSIIWNGTVLADGDRIADFGEANDVVIPKNAEVIDAGGKYTAPGLVDIHCHGGGGHWFYENPEGAAEYFLQNGTTTILATLYNNLSKEMLLSAMDKIKEAMNNADSIAGIYMEGPYLNPNYGGDTKNSKWKGEVDRAVYMDIVDKGRGLVKIWGVSPEKPGIDKFVEDAKYEGTIFAASHTEATPEQLYALIPMGLKVQTHHMNATGAKSALLGVKGAGVDEAVGLCDDIYAELIVDSQAVHVNKYNIRLALKYKGRDKIILISDATEFGSVGQSDAPDLRFDDNGDLCGSSLTLAQACQNMMKHTGSGICDVFRMGSLNPAKLLGMQNEIGSIEKGKRANLVIADDMINVEHVILEGRIVR